MSLVDHPWHVPTDVELERAAEIRFGRLFPDLRGGWAGLSDENRATQIALAERYVVDVVGPTARRVLEQAAERADAEGARRLAAWLRALSQEVEV